MFKYSLFCSVFSLASVFGQVSFYFKANRSKFRFEKSFKAPYYQFGYQVDTLETGDYHGHMEQLDGITKRGKFSDLTSYELC